MNRVTVLGVSLLLLPLLAGCKKSACEMGKPQPVTFPWDKHQDLVPPGAKVCGVANNDPSTLEMSFAKDDNPFVTTVRHLEDKGWTRAEQDTKNPDFLTAQLRKGNDEIQLTAQRTRGFENHVSLGIADHDCAGTTAKDKSACRNQRGADSNQVIKCNARNYVGDGPKCAADEHCMTNASNGSPLLADTAHCRKL